MTASELYKLLDKLQDQLYDNEIVGLRSNESTVIAKKIESILLTLDGLDKVT